MTWSPLPWARRTFALDVRSLACFRIAIGSIVVADALLRTRDISVMLAPDGMFPLATLREFFGDGWAWSLAFAVDATWWGCVILALEALAGAALAAGWFTRVATVAAWVAVVSIVRRTAPASNAGDDWLCCLLFWGMFLPLGATWSVDAWRRGRAASPAPNPYASAATAALVLQIAAVYVGAGTSKWNATWLSGSAVATALSLHDHGTVWGEALAGHETACRLLTWAIVGLECAGPVLLLATGRPVVRLTLAMLFLGFHLATAFLMSLGLFAYVGMAAWLAILPDAWWRWLSRNRVLPADLRPTAPAAVSSMGGRLETVVVASALAVATASFLHGCTSWRSRPAPAMLRALVHLSSLGQDWSMFGEVPRQRQWVFGRGILVDGRVVDVLRGGRSLVETLPAGGFTSLPHHRWHKLFWALASPSRRIFANSVTAALATDWNRRHRESDALVSLEIRAVRILTDTAGSPLRHELLLGSWPARDALGTGNLERRLDHRPPP